MFNAVNEVLELPIARSKMGGMQAWRNGTVARRRETNWVQIAVKKAGGRTKVALACGVANNTVHYWLQKGRVHQVQHAIRLSEVSGVPIEKLSK